MSDPDSGSRETPIRGHQRPLASFTDRYRAAFRRVREAAFIVDKQGRILDLNAAATNLTGYVRKDLEQVSMWKIASHKAGDLSAIVGDLDEGDEVIGTCTITSANHQQIDAEFSVFAEADCLFTFLLREQDRGTRLVESLHSRLRQQQLLADFGMYALREPALDLIFARATEVVADGLEVEFSKVLRLTPERDAVRLMSGIGWVEALVGDGLVPIGIDSQAGYTLATEAPVIVDDLREEKRFSGPALLRNHGIVSGVSCIIGPFEHPWGVLGAHTQARRQFSRNDANFVSGVANIIAQAVASRAADERAVEQELRLELALQAADLVIWQLNAETGEMKIEGDWERALGLPEGHLGSNIDELLDVVHDNDRDELKDALDAHLNGSSPLFSATFRVETERDGFIWLSSRGRVVTWGGDGQPWRVLGVHENVTDRIEAEEVRRDLEAQLQHAHKMEAVGRLAGGVAHDFNNILTTINGYVDLILSDAESGTQLSEDLQEILGAAKRARALTGQLLAFSRKEVVQAKVLPVDEALEQMSRILHQILGESVLLELDLNAERGKIMIDPGQFEQLVLNLATNAKDAMSDGGAFSISTRTFFDSEDETECVELVFRDDGCGMDEELLAKVFEPFFTTKAGGDGTGLGLALVYSLVEQAGGRVTVESEPGVGTAFRVEMPMTDALLEDSDEVDLFETLSGRERILFVEDDERLRQLGVRILEHAGYDVSAAANATQAEAIARSSLPFHILLTDVVMPGPSGPELARKLRQEQPNLSVLFVSGYNEDDALQDDVARNRVAYLPKPFTPRALLRSVRAALQKDDH